ncbi:hypothetical protein QE418_000194 [Microbacterium testaceum]|nr:hypothetical protein [Microbacterium testaceum]
MGERRLPLRHRTQLVPHARGVRPLLPPARNERRRTTRPGAPRPGVPRLRPSWKGRADRHRLGPRGRARAVRRARARLGCEPRGLPRLGEGRLRAVDVEVPLRPLLVDQGSARPRARETPSHPDPAADAHAVEARHHGLQEHPVAADPRVPRGVPRRITLRGAEPLPPHEPPRPGRRRALPQGRHDRDHHGHREAGARARRHDRDLGPRRGDHHRVGHRSRRAARRRSSDRSGCRGLGRRSAPHRERSARGGRTASTPRSGGRTRCRAPAPCCCCSE